MSSKISDLINSSKSIVLLAHESPDGDAIGSVMAFYYYLKNNNKDVDIVFPKIPDNFLSVKDINIALADSNKEYDLGIVVDCANKKRIGQVSNVFDRCIKTINIDHHVSNTKYSDVNYVKGEIAACCQVIYYLFKEWNISIDTDISSALMMGVLTDTNGFMNNDVDKDTFLMAAEIKEKDIDINNISMKFLTRKSMAQIKLMKIVIDRLEFFLDGKIAFSYMTKEDMENVCAKMGDHEGLVNIGRNIEGVEASVFIREDDGYKVSLRSNGLVDVNVIASKFGGGGHPMAAGIKFNSNFKETKDNIINEIIKELSV